LSADNGDRYGLSGLDASVPSAQDQTDQLRMVSTETYNVKAPMFFGTQDFVNDPIFMRRSDGTCYYGHHAAWGTVTPVFVAVVCVNGVVTAGDTITVTAVNGSNQVVAVSAGAAAGQQVFSITSATCASLLTVDPTYGAGVYACGRSNPVGFRVSGNFTGTTAVNLTSININLSGTVAPTNDFVLVPYDWKDQGSFLQNLTA
jgi:hypothetical protein